MTQREYWEALSARFETAKADSGQERIKYDIERCKDLFRALLETLSPEQLEKVSHYLKV